MVGWRAEAIDHARRKVHPPPTSRLFAGAARRIGCATMLVQISDPHLRTDDDDSAAALAAAVERIRSLPDQPDAVLLSGDVADSGSEAEYALARELLAPLTMPVHLIAGNHDRMPERSQYAVRCGDLRLVAC